VKPVLCPASPKPRKAVSSETERPAGSAEASEKDADAVLRAKYADFCSAQLTEVFLSLSDERIYEIVQEEAHAQDLGAGALGFRSMVRLATGRLRDSVPLPDFETWKTDYEAEPERYDRYLLGLWQELTGDREPGDTAGEGEGE
jgi:hypothetical protein